MALLEDEQVEEKEKEKAQKLRAEEKAMNEMVL